MDLFTASPSKFQSAVSNFGMGTPASPNGDGGSVGSFWGFLSAFRVPGVTVIVLLVAFVAAIGYLIYTGLNRVFAELNNQRNILTTELGFASRLHKDVSVRSDEIKQLQERQGTLLDMLVSSLQNPLVDEPEYEEDDEQEEGEEEMYEGDDDQVEEIDDSEQADADGWSDEQEEEDEEQSGAVEDENADPNAYE